MNESINLFELIENIRQKLSEEGDVKLETYEIKLTIKNFDNNPHPRINFELLVFGQELGTSYFDYKRNTIDDVVKFLILHAKEDCGFSSLRDGLISSKISSLNQSLKRQIDKIRDMLRSKYPDSIVNAQIEEKSEKYKNGFPLFFLDVWVTRNKIVIKRFKQDIEFYPINFYKSEIFENIAKSSSA